MQRGSFGFRAMWRRSHLSACIILVLALTLQPALGQPPPLEPAPLVAGSETQVRADTIRESVERLTNRAMDGRGTAQAGGLRAAEWITSRMKALGLKPAGDQGSYLQDTGIREFTLAGASTLRIGDQTFHAPRDFTVSWAMSQSRVRPRMEATGKLVFVGYGISAPMLGRDDLARADLRGKIALLLPGLPPEAKGPPWDAFVWKAVQQELARRGASAVLTLTNDINFDHQSDRRHTLGLTGRGTREFPALALPLEVSRSVAEAILTGSGETLDSLITEANAAGFRARPVNKAAKISLQIEFARNPSPAYNVAGVLVGSDPALRQEAVVYSAHYDAFGIDARGRVYPGAADNALGVGNMLAIAEALARSPRRPRRSVLFLSTTGEEYGLVGAAYWTTHPTWPLSRIVANLNFDGYGTEVWGPVSAIFAMGLTHSNLGETLRRSAAELGMKLYGDPTPERQAFLRGDQWEFARHGVPALVVAGVGGNFLSALARVKKFEDEDYHQPTDIIRPDWDWTGAAQLARFYLLTGLQLANADGHPALAPGSAFLPNETSR